MVPPGSGGGIEDAHETFGPQPVHGLWRLLGPALLSWAATAALIHLPGAARVVALCAAVAGIGACAFIWVRFRRGESVNARTGAAGALLGFVLIASAALVLLGARIDVLEQARSSEFLVEVAEKSRQVSAQAKIAGYPETIEGIGGEKRAWVRAELVSAEGQRPSQPVTVMLWLSKPPPVTWSAGTRVSLSGVLTQQAPESRSAFDISVREIEETGAAASARSPIASITRLPAELRFTLREAAKQQSGAELVPGLAVGDTSLVDQPLDDLMTESSLSHLVAVSGSNCALVIMVAIAAASRLGAGRRLRIFIAAGALGSFVVLVGPDASVQRAAIMAAVLLLSNFSSKSRQALPSLGLAILVLLCIDPWQSIQAGFALSVMATMGILLGVAPLEQWLRVHVRLPKLLALPIAIASIAQFACAPLLLLLQPGLPISGVLANILAAPVAPAGTALGMATMLLLPLHGGLGEIVLWVATWPARWIEASGTLAVALPMGRWYWPGGWGGTLLLAAVEALVIAVWIMTGGGSRAVGPWRGKVLRSTRTRVWLRTVTGAVVGLVVAVVIVVPVSVRAGVPRDWIVVVCDVGQGDAIMLRDPKKPQSVMLVDTGDDPVKLRTCLDLFGVREIELLVLTHDHRDHYGAMSEVLPDTAKVLLAPPAREHKPVRPVADTLAAYDAPVFTGEMGNVGGSHAGMQWQILGPRPAPDYAEANSTCLVLLVEVAGISLLLLADTGEQEQHWLAQAYPGLSADIVKVAHHGSKDQASGFYEGVGASIALISVGENRYGHPNGNLIDSLLRSGSAILRTDNLGSIALSVESVRDSEKPNIVSWTVGDRSGVLGDGSSNVWGSG